MSLERIDTDEAKRMADAFLAGRDATFDPAVQQMLTAVTRKVHEEFERLPVRVEFVDYDPYANYEEMRDQALSTGVLRIWKGASDVPMWDPLTNWKVRAVHDWDHISQQFDFSIEGEYEGFLVASRKAPQLAPIFMSEVALQAAVSEAYGAFVPEQKIVLLDPATRRWAEQLRGPEQANVPYVRAVAAMLNVMSQEDAMAVLGASGFSLEDATALVEAGSIYNALAEGQLEAA